jgi:hypothetical protein
LPADTAAAPRGFFTASVNFPEAEGDAANGVYGPVRVSTCHLVTPTPTDVRSMERGAEASLFLDTLSWCWYRNSVLGGDMSWDDDLDGAVPG